MSLQYLLRPYIVYFIILVITILLIHEPWVRREDIVQEELNQQNQQMKWRCKGPLVADDPQLIAHIRQTIKPPSLLPYNLTLNSIGKYADDYNSYRKTFPSWMRTNHIIQMLFSEKLHGYFFEAGAMDGEFVSNTLDLEINQGWTGILVEGDPKLGLLLQKKHRRAWTSNSCISPTNYAQQLTFMSYKETSSSNIIDHLLTRSTSGLASVLAPARGMMGRPEPPTTVQCYPLLSYFMAVNITKIDLMILDVEGSEADIVMNFPWDKVNITVLHIEHRPENNKFSKKKRSNNDKMQQQKYNKKSTSKQPEIIFDRNPKEGKDTDFVKFMNSKGYTLLLYYDGDYTFVQSYSLLCGRYCDDPQQLLRGYVT